MLLRSRARIREVYQESLKEFNSSTAKGLTDSDIRASDLVPLYLGQGRLRAPLTPIPPIPSRHGGKLAGILQRAVCRRICSWTVSMLLQ